MIKQYNISLPAYKRGFHIINSEIMREVGQLPDSGIMHVFIQHTSAGITINENTDPTVLQDFEKVFNKLVPEGLPYYMHNAEGDDDMPAHIKSTLVGSSVTIPITESKLNFGTWQSIYLCEFRNSGGRRKLIVTIFS